MDEKAWEKRIKNGTISNEWRFLAGKSTLNGGFYWDDKNSLKVWNKYMGKALKIEKQLRNILEFSPNFMSMIHFTDLWPWGPVSQWRSPGGLMAEGWCECFCLKIWDPIWFCLRIGYPWLPPKSSR
jgi:hypothetical protein